MPNGERPRSPEEWQEIARGNLTEEERKELDLLEKDELVQKYIELRSIYTLPEKGLTLEEAAQELKKFEEEHPEVKEKYERIRELEKKAGEGAEFIPSGM